MKLSAFLLVLGLIASPALAQHDLSAPEAGTLAWHNAQQSALHSRTSEQGWSTLEGGVKFRRVKGDGSGPAPKVSDVVRVNYTGTFFDGEVFDSTDGGPPAEFPLSRLIKGWQIGIPYLGVGDTAQLVIPAELAYGLRNGGPIPGGATLIFEIELVAIPSQPGA